MTGREQLKQLDREEKEKIKKAEYNAKIAEQKQEKEKYRQEKIAKETKKAEAKKTLARWTNAGKIFGGGLNAYGDYKKEKELEIPDGKEPKSKAEKMIEFGVKHAGAIKEGFTGVGKGKTIEGGNMLDTVLQAGGDIATAEKDIHANALKEKKQQYKSQAMLTEDEEMLKKLGDDKALMDIKKLKDTRTANAAKVEENKKTREDRQVQENKKFNQKTQEYKNKQNENALKRKSNTLNTAMKNKIYGNDLKEYMENPDEFLKTHRYVPNAGFSFGFKGIRAKHGGGGRWEKIDGARR